MSDEFFSRLRRRITTRRATDADPFDERFDDDAESLILTRQLDAAFGVVLPDVGRLVSGGLEVGAGIRHRRRLATAAGLAVASVVAVMMLLTGSVAGLLGLHTPGPTDQNKIGELVPASPRGLAYAVMQHTSSLGTLGRVAGAERDAGGVHTLSVSLGYRRADATRVEVDVTAVSPVPASLQHKRGCGGVSLQRDATCHAITEPDGTRLVLVSDSTRPGTVDAVLRISTASALVVAETFPGSSVTDPSVMENLRALADDPRVGALTTPAVNDAGAAIPHFRSRVDSSGLTTRVSSHGGGVAKRVHVHAIKRPHR